jgi:hypothetical protein
MYSQGSVDFISVIQCWQSLVWTNPIMGSFRREFSRIDGNLAKRYPPWLLLRAPTNYLNIDFFSYCMMHYVCSASRLLLCLFLRNAAAKVSLFLRFNLLITAVKMFLFVTSAIDGGECSASRPGPLYPLEFAPDMLCIGDWASLRADMSNVEWSLTTAVKWTTAVPRVALTKHTDPQAFVHSGACACACACAWSNGAAKWISSTGHKHSL